MQKLHSQFSASLLRYQQTNLGGGGGGGAEKWFTGTCRRTWCGHSRVMLTSRSPKWWHRRESYHGVRQRLRVKRHDNTGTREPFPFDQCSSASLCWGVFETRSSLFSLEAVSFLYRGRQSPKGSGAFVFGWGHGGSTKLRGEPFLLLCFVYGKEKALIGRSKSSPKSGRRSSLAEPDGEVPHSYRPVAAAARARCSTSHCLPGMMYQTVIRNPTTTMGLVPNTVGIISTVLKGSSALFAFWRVRGSDNCTLEISGNKIVLKNKKPERPRTSERKNDDVINYACGDACLKVACANVKSVKKSLPWDAPVPCAQEHPECTDLLCQSWDVQ